MSNDQTDKCPCTKCGRLEDCDPQMRGTGVIQPGQANWQKVITNPALRQAIAEWAEQGRTEEQIYGVTNFFTGRGLAWAALSPEANKPCSLWWCGQYCDEHLQALPTNNGSGGDTEPMPKDQDKDTELDHLLDRLVANTIRASTYDYPEVVAKHKANMAETKAQIKDLINEARIEELNWFVKEGGDERLSEGGWAEVRHVVIRKRIKDLTNRGKE